MFDFELKTLVVFDFELKTLVVFDNFVDPKISVFYFILFLLFYIIILFY